MKKVWDETRLDACRAMRKAGLSYEQIGLAFGVAESTVRHHMGVITRAPVSPTVPIKVDDKQFAKAMEGLRFEDHPKAAPPSPMPQRYAPALPDRSIYGGSL